MNIHKRFSRMNPIAPNRTLTTNYDKHTITLYDVDPWHLKTFKGTISGPVYNNDINFNINFAISETKFFSTGSIIGHGSDSIILVITYDEPIDISGWRMRMKYNEPIDISGWRMIIALPGGFLEGVDFDDMDKCIFSEVMPTKGVNSG